MPPDALLQAIYDDPADDHPRQVYADALTDAGDVRGEFISLQLARAQGRGSSKAALRESKLLGEPAQRAEWAAPFAPQNGVRFSRGFVESVNVGGRDTGKIVKAPQWQTVTRVTGLISLAAQHVAQLLDGKAGRHLREVGELTPTAMKALGKAPRPWTHVQFRMMPSPTELSRFEKLESVRLWPQKNERIQLGPETLAPVANTLQSLEVNWTRIPTAKLLASLPRLRSLNVDAEGVEAARGLGNLTVLRCRCVPSPKDLEGHPLERLTIAGHPTAAQLAKLVAAAPSLKVLRVEAIAPQPAHTEAVLDALRGSKLEELWLNYLGFTDLKGPATAMLRYLGPSQLEPLRALKKGTLGAVRLLPITDSVEDKTSLARGELAAAKKVLEGSGLKLVT